LSLFSFVSTEAQTDTTKKPVPVDSLMKSAAPVQNRKAVDSVRRLHSPKKATFRSLVLPGWGQAYNKKYWKIPIVYGALGITGGVFVYNLKNYREIRFAYSAKYKAALPKFDPANPRPGPYQDSSDYGKIKANLLPLGLNTLRFYRDDFRKNIDYSVLFFLLFWGLNVVDATVDGHLKAFDVSPDLSLRFKVGPSQFAGTTGASLVLLFK
ncbi:MAG TPA: DUF5683 domain-containing protein, partial [Flavisolibacter sp.]|nr:DUF5683 domain-containing protein [Flavisolibacter sp.]